MLKKFLLTIALGLLLMLLSMQKAPAQSPETPRFEAGLHFVAPDAETNDMPPSPAGGGARFTWNLNRSLALEGEGNVFTRHGKAVGRRAQGLFGVKAGARFSQFGIFGKVRPGFTYFKDAGHNSYLLYDPRCPADQFRLGRCTPSYDFPIEHPDHYDFTFDLGGVIEFYPARRLVVRFDVGDTMVRYRAPLRRFVPSVPEVVVDYLSPATHHSLQVSTGLAFRF